MQVGVGASLGVKVTVRVTSAVYLGVAVSPQAGVGDLRGMHGIWTVALPGAGRLSRDSRGFALRCFSLCSRRRICAPSWRFL